MAKKLTIHVVSHAHIDPVWMWRKPEGIDEALATVRSACDRLREYPEMTYIQGEAWIYEQIERLDPELFRSIAELVEVVEASGFTPVQRDALFDEVTPVLA